MKNYKELKHFMINNRYGGNQEWMLDPWLRLGGCGALAAVDSCIFFAKHHHVNRTVGDVSHLTKGRYICLAHEMKPYLRPRFMGINKLEIYRLGFGKYLQDRKVTAIHMEEYPMGSSKDVAWEVYKGQIDHNILVPVLLLNPISKEWKEYNWHWFLLNGYQEEDGERLVQVVTYGGREWLHWDTFWDEEDAENGGMILYSIKSKE